MLETDDSGMLLSANEKSNTHDIFAVGGENEFSRFPAVVRWAHTGHAPLSWPVSWQWPSWQSCPALAVTNIAECTEAAANRTHSASVNSRRAPACPCQFVIELFIVSNPAGPAAFQ